MNATSYGTGELIKFAVSKGFKNIILGLGGSGCCDAGAGALAALGAVFRDIDGDEIDFPAGKDLNNIYGVGFTNIVKDINFTFACDVENVFFGKNGAAYVFAKQKGANDKQVKELLKKQNGFAWPYYLISPRKYEVETMISFDEEKLKDVLDNLSCMDESKWTDSENAQIKDYTKDGYEVQPEVYGTKIDKDAFTEKIKEALDKMQPEFDLSGEGCYEDPKVKEEDDVFQDALDTLNKYTQMKITYQAEGKDDVVLDGETISTWLSVDDDFNVSVDDEALSAYVKAMAKNYNTAYGNRTLDTSYGQTVTIYGGNYGWWVDNAAEKEMILEDLKAGKDVKREPVYSQTANSHGENDYGNTYVEINLTAQHLFFYKNGSLVVESDFVSGNLAKNHGTPSGSFGVTYKAKDAVLRGEDYESPVSFWMPFNGGVGMHDASWRSTFGGTIYKRSGSENSR